MNNLGSQPEEPSVKRLEAKKREVLIDAIDRVLPTIARANKDSAHEFAKKTLEDIQQGNNPDLEPQFRQKIQELGIEIKLNEEERVLFSKTVEHVKNLIISPNF